MQSVHGTGEPGLDAIKVTNWNLANKVVTLAYFQGKMNFFGNCFPKKQSDNKRVTSNPKKHGGKGYTPLLTDADKKRWSESLILHQPRLQIHPMSTPSSLRKMSLLVHSSVRWHSLMRMEMWWRSLISLQKVRMRQR